MNNYLRDRGVQASIVTMGVLATVTAVSYSPPLPPLLAVWAAWAGVTAWAVWIARGKAHA